MYHAAVMRVYHAHRPTTSAAPEQENEIGQEHALFYEAEATYLELRGSYAKATAAFEAGIERSGPQPLPCGMCRFVIAHRRNNRSTTLLPLLSSSAHVSGKTATLSVVVARIARGTCQQSPRMGATGISAAQLLTPTVRLPRRLAHPVQRLRAKFQDFQERMVRQVAPVMTSLRGVRTRRVRCSRRFVTRPAHDMDG